MKTMRVWYGLGAAICFALIGFALFSQIQWGLIPCPLCIFQRIGFACTGLVLLIGAVHAPKSWGRFVYAALASVMAILGGGVAARHVWLTHLPADQVPSCGPSLDFLLQAFPMWTAVQTVLRGSGECAKVDWTFLHLSMPAWSLLWFVVLLCVAWLGAVKTGKSA